MIIGLMNFGVSFALALWIALRAKEVTGRERLKLGSMVARRFLRKPLQFFWPPKTDKIPGRAGTDPPVASH